MCFRVAQEGEDLSALVRAIEDLFGDLVIQDAMQPAANIALTDMAMVVVQRPDALHLRNMRFGLVPNWKKTPDLALGNARAETVDTLPSYKEAFQKHRCLIPVTGFYEWRLDPSEKKKTPYKVTTDDPIFCLAGVWDYWPPQKITSFAIITTEPNALIAQLHNRMPVVLPPEHHPAWLDPANEDTAALKAMLQPYPPERMAYQAYDRYVSNSRNKDHKLIVPVGEPITLK